MQREPGGCTRDEVHSGPGAPQLGLIDRNDVSGVANARGNLAADRAGPAPKKSVVSAAIVMPEPRAQGFSQMLLGQGDHPIQTLTPECPD